MNLYAFFILLLTKCLFITANLDFLDPTLLQTRTSPAAQREAAYNVISKYLNDVTVEVNPILFSDNKDVFAIHSTKDKIRIRASTGVAAVWGFNYFLKKYFKSHIGWQVQHISTGDAYFPEVDEVIVANDRFRYYQNVCTASYSFLWWDESQWIQHVDWMALNGINLSLAPIAQEAIWAQIYKQIGMTDEEINQHFTGPAFLSWLRMGNVRGWGGPLYKSWYDRQRRIQDSVLDYMFKLGIVPVLPAFNGHVPRAFARIFPNSTFHTVQTWNKFSDDFCCGLFLDPNDPLFKTIGTMFLKAVTVGTGTNHIYAADPFNEIEVEPWSTALVQQTAEAIFSTISQVDNKAVWLIQNWMFVHNPLLWPKNRVKSFLTSVPNGRMLILDLQSEQWPQYELYEMYFGQPFIWCMLHNFGGTLGMFGNMQTINKDVYEARTLANSTMIGIGLTPEGINQNYVVYDLMLESAWRKTPVADLDAWISDYAERRHGCNKTAAGWKYLLKSVYSFNGLNKMRGKYVITRQPSFKIRPWAWYKSSDLFEAFKRFAFVSDDACNNDGFYHDLVDVTRQALQYRAEQLYLNLQMSWYSNVWVFNTTANKFLDVMYDIQQILYTHKDFMASNWLTNATSFSANTEETYLYEMNARNQITLWGPNGEIADYACKQWAELFEYYYIPRWRAFLTAALDAKMRNENFDEKAVQKLIRNTIEEDFVVVTISGQSGGDPKQLALKFYQKWAHVPGLEELPNKLIKIDDRKSTTFADTDIDDNAVSGEPTVLLWHSTTNSD